MFGWGRNQQSAKPSDALDMLIQAAQQLQDQRIARLAKRFATADRFVAEVQRAFPHLLPYMQFDVHGWQSVEITLPATMAMTITTSLEDEAWCIAAGSYERLIPLDAADREARFLMVLADYRDMREHVATYA